MQANPNTPCAPSSQRRLVLRLSTSGLQNIFKIHGKYNHPVQKVIWSAGNPKSVYSTTDTALMRM